jgi:tetratricopeptide (TPR) repeat protein
MVQARAWSVETSNQISSHPQSPNLQSPISSLQFPISQSLPPKVYGVIQARLAQLSPSAQELVGLAATIGRSFTFEVLWQASRMDEHALVHAVDELWRRRIVREQSAAAASDAYDFSHERIREVAYGELSAVRRRLYHRAVAAGLVHVYGEKLEEWSAQIAHHYDQAENHAQARHYYCMAGRRAAAQFAHGEAMGYFTRALHLFGDQREQDRCGRFELHALRERVYHLQTSRDAQEEELATMLALADALDDDEKRCTVLLRRAALQEGRGAYAAAADTAQQAMQYARAGGNRRQQAEGHVQLGSVFWNCGDYLQCGGQYEQALQITQATGERAMEASILLHFGALNAYCGDFDFALQISEQALAANREVGASEGEIWAHNQLGFCIVEQGDDDYARAAFHLTTGLALARKIGSRAYVAKLANNLAMLYYRQGEYSLALAALDESLAAAGETGSARHKAFSLNHRANTLEHQGAFAAAEQHYMEALALFQKIGYRQGIGKTASEIGLLHIWLGDCATALQWLEQAQAIVQPLGIRRDQAAVLVRTGYALEGLACRQEAASHYEQALAVYRLTGQRNRALEPMAGLARLALARGDRQCLLDLVEPILTRLHSHELDATNEALWVHFTCGQALQALGDPRAPGLLRHAQELLARRWLDADFARQPESKTPFASFCNAFATPAPLSSFSTM